MSQLLRRMSEQEKLTLFALAEFRPLVDDCGFNEPFVVKENWITRIDYLVSVLFPHLPAGPLLG